MTDKRSQLLCLNFYRLKYTLVNLTYDFIKNMFALFKHANELCLCCENHCQYRGNANVRCVTFTNDVRNNRNTVAFEKWDLVLSQNRSLFNYSVQIEDEK